MFRLDETSMPGAFAPGYWVAHCEGFRVESADGSVGYVDAVEDGGAGGPESLLVRAGPGGCRLIVIPVGQVEEIIPSAERVVLRPGWTLDPVR